MNDAERVNERLLELLAGKVRAQALSTAAEIGLPDSLAQGPATAAELARRLNCEPRALESLARFLVGLGVLAQPTPGTFALTEMGQGLRSDALGPLAAFIGAPDQWDAWSRLRDALRGGACAFERTYGQSLYAFLANDCAAGQRYDAAIDAFTRHEARALCEHYDFSQARHLVDVGGGRGSLLEALLERWPHLQGTLLELPHVAGAAQCRFESSSGRLRAVQGDFFEGILAGADHYLVKHVLHNWSDDECVRILENCARGAGRDGRVLVVEAILSPDGRADVAGMLDLEMLVLTGGRERRKPELRRLFNRAGLKVEHMHALLPGAWLAVLSVRAEVKPAGRRRERA